MFIQVSGCHRVLGENRDGRTAATYGGAERRRASIIEKPIALSKIVMKNPIAYAGVVEAKNMKATQTLSPAVPDAGGRKTHQSST